MKTVQAYVQGTRHVRQGKVCQDRTGFLKLNNVYSIALSDGAGNPRYTYSEYGAEVVVDTVTRFFCNNFDRFYEAQDEKELSRVLITVLVKALKKKAEELGADSIDRLASTMLAVAVKDNRVIICHLGDGAIGAVTMDGSKVVSAPDNGEYANSTYFVTGQGASDHLKITRKTVTDEIGFFLMSDGTADYCYDDNANMFRDGARKMALLAFDPDSREALHKTIVEKMIGDDTNSDDCSFVSLMFDDQYSYEGGKAAKDFSDVQGLGVGIEDRVSPNAADRDISRSTVMGLKKVNGGDDHKREVKEESPESKKKKTAGNLITVLIASLVLMIVFVASLFMINKSNEKTNNSTEVETHIDDNTEEETDTDDSGEKIEFETIEVPVEVDAKDSAAEESLPKEFRPTRVIKPHDSRLTY